MFVVGAFQRSKLRIHVANTFFEVFLAHATAFAIPLYSYSTASCTHTDTTWSGKHTYIEGQLSSST